MNNSATGKDPRQRFSDRVKDYTLYRPGYPADALNYIVGQSNIGSHSTVADVGSGTGIFTEHLLSVGAVVIAVEPNEAMRLASDVSLGSHDNYQSQSGSAEQTGLQDHSIDLITAAQAFHWFDVTVAKKEFRRVLKPEGMVALIWNRRDSRDSEFMQQYDALLKNRLPEYNQVNHSNASDELVGEFLGGNMQTADFPSHQQFDLVGLKGRLMSSSYCPAPGSPGHDELMVEIEKLYERYAGQAGVQFDYRTQIYLG